MVRLHLGKKSISKFIIIASEGLGYPAEPSPPSSQPTGHTWLTRLRKHILSLKGPELETRSQRGLQGTVGEPENSAGPADAHGPSG